MNSLFRIYTNTVLVLKLARTMKSAADGNNPTYNSLLGIASSFWDGLTNAQSSAADKKMRKNLNEKKIDKMIESSFPASDPPSTY